MCAVESERELACLGGPATGGRWPASSSSSSWWRKWIHLIQRAAPERERAQFCPTYLTSTYLSSAQLTSTHLTTADFTHFIALSPHHSPEQQQQQQQQVEAVHTSHPFSYLPIVCERVNQSLCWSVSLLCIRQTVVSHSSSMLSKADR